MHILFFAPYFTQPRGNSTTIKRLVHFLQQKNISTSVIPYAENDNWHRPQADIFHILHATRFLHWAKQSNFALDRPYVVTMGGTDINVDLQASMSQDMFAFLNDASYITVFTKDSLEKIMKLCPRWTDKTFVISQGVWLPWSLSAIKGEFAPHILLPAGLRPVKDVLHTLPALDELSYEYSDMTFTILGANLDKEVYKRVQREEERHHWMTYAGVVPFEVMKLWYEQAHIVINTSISEGQSLALMEAMALGRPVIARNNKANTHLVRHEQTGWLYSTPNEFKEAVRSIIGNNLLREKVVQQAREWIAINSSPEKEAAAYIDLYSHI